MLHEGISFTQISYNFGCFVIFDALQKLHKFDKLQRKFDIEL